MPLLPPDALQVLQSALTALQSHPAGLAINGLALALLGLTALRAAAGVAAYVWAYFLRPARNLKFYGAWAVVTGATDGIGKAYCEELAKKGMPGCPGLPCCAQRRRSPACALHVHCARCRPEPGAGFPHRVQAQGGGRSAGERARRASAVRGCGPEPAHPGHSGPHRCRPARPGGALLPPRCRVL